MKGTKRKNIEEESTLVSRRSSRPNAGTKSTRLVEMEQIGRKYATNETTLIIEDEKEKSLKYIERSKKQRLQKYIETIEKKMAPKKIPLSFTKSIEAANIWIADEARKEKAKEISTKYTETAKKKNAPKTISKKSKKSIGAANATRMTPELHKDIAEEALRKKEAEVIEVLGFFKAHAARQKNGISDAEFTVGTTQPNSNSMMAVNIPTINNNNNNDSNDIIPNEFHEIPRNPWCNNIDWLRTVGHSHCHHQLQYNRDRLHPY